MEDHSVPFALALSVTRAGNICTTHNAVPAGFDRFAPDLLRNYLTHSAVNLRESMARLTPEFSASRAVRDYAEKHYVPAAAFYVSRGAYDSLVAKQILKQQNDLAQHWSSLRLDPANITMQGEKHSFKVKLANADFPSNSYRVELNANAEQEAKADLYTMPVSQDASRPEGNDIYSVEVPALRSAADYSVRVVPEHAQAFVPLEAAAILWAQ